jgi:uncharacterized protein with beta-barrel porin domain
MSRIQSMALRSNRRISQKTGLAERSNQRRVGTLSSGVSLTVLAAAIAVSGGALLDAPMAHAQGITNVTLSGSQTTTQTVSGSTVTVDTAPAFGVVTTTGRAIDVRGNDGTTFTDANTSTITGQTDGIFIRNTYNGALSLTTSGTVTGTTSDGIVAQNRRGSSEYGEDSGRPTNLTISTAAVSGGSSGIYANNDGTGSLSITSTGQVTGSTGSGIEAFNNYGTSLTIMAAGVTGDEYGIYAYNDGSGALSITATGTVTATANDESYGIYAENFGTDLTVSAAAVSGGYGIYAANYGTGALSVTATGAVTGSAYKGIYAKNYGTDLTITATNVSGVDDGIEARNYGSGALSITTTGTVTATSASEGGNGIDARNSSYTSESSESGYNVPTNLTISTAAVTGSYNGIFARNSGSGALSITSTGTVTGTSSTGIYASNSIGESGYNGRPYGIPTDLTISTAAVTGGNTGIFARNFGTGALSITSTGTVTGTSNIGIYALNGSNYRSKFPVNVATFAFDAESPGDSRPTPTSLTISATSVSGGRDGIRARNNGTGALSITTTGTVTGTNGRGIYATNGRIGQYYGYYFGGRLSALNAAEPLLDSGYTFRAGTDLTISTAAVSGGTNGIVAFNNGSGALTITSTGTVTGTSGRGIFASNGGVYERTRFDGESSSEGIAPGYNLPSFAGTNLTVTATSVSGGTDGILARNFGTGALTITSTGTVTGTSGRGIFASNGGIAEGGVPVWPADDTRLAVSADILDEMSGEPSYAGTSLTITAASVSGGISGIEAVNYGTGALSVTASGAVMGGTGAGISTLSKAAAPVAITLTPTASVSATSGMAIVDGVGDATVTINGGAVVTGSIALGDGNDTLTLRNGTPTAGITSLDGGSGAFTDTLNLGTSVTGDIGSWEIVNADTSAGNFALDGILLGSQTLNKLGSGNLTILGTNTLIGGTFISGGRLNVNGSLTNSLITVQNGGTLGGTGTTGTVIVQSGGTIAPGNSIGTLSVAGDLTLNAGSTTAIEISPNSADLLAVTGTAALAGTLAVLPEAGAFFGRTYTIVTASSVTGTFATTTLGAPLTTAFRTTVLYSPTMVQLRLDPNSLVQLGGGRLRGNTLAAAAAIDTAVERGFNPQPFIALYNTPGANLPAAVRQISGELHSGERRVALQDTRIVRETAFDRLNAGPAAAPGTSAVTKEAGDTSKTIWMRVAGSWGIARGDSIGSRQATDQAAILIGADWAQGGFKMGGMFSYITTNLDMLTFGRSRVESIGGAFYTGYRQEGSGFSVGLGAALASTSARGNRSITIPGLTQTLRSNVNGLTYQIFAEGAYDLAKADNVRVEPFARIAYAGLDSKAFTETGGIAALRGGAQKNQLTTATFGMRGGIVTGQTTLSSSAGWQRTGGDRSAPTLLSIATINAPYFVESAALDRDALAVEAQAAVSISSSFTFSLGYSGVLGRRNSDHGARATARVTF